MRRNKSKDVDSGRMGVTKGKGRLSAHLPAEKRARELRQAEFLKHYSLHFSIKKAAELAGIDPKTHYNWLEADQSGEYRAAFQVAREKAIDALEDEAMRRAKEGTEKPVTVAGQREVIRDYSDVLLIFLLKAARPEKYRDRQVVDIPQLGELVDRLAAGRRRVNEVEVNVTRALPPHTNPDPIP